MSPLSDNILATPSGLIAYITAGDGGLDRTLSLLQACDAAGVALIELGIPFSDPIADGPVLQAAAQRALEQGTSLRKTLDVLARFRAKSNCPVAIFSYANPLFRMGYDTAARAMKEAGANAVLIPDMPVEASAPLRDATAKEDIATVLFASPTTEDERLIDICNKTRGFLYAIGRFGVTGGATELDADLDRFLDRIRAHAKTPIGVGFGLRRRDQVEYILDRADYAVVGSALVDHIHRSTDPAQACYDFLSELNGTG